jgi:hypothetical protein
MATGQTFSSTSDYRQRFYDDVIAETSHVSLHGPLYLS